jgi:hypothetical protein
MQCQHARELFSDYVEKTLDRALSVSLENHLETCSACREEVEGLRHVWTMLDEMPLEEPSLYFHENVMSRLDAERAAVEETAARKRAFWDWKAWFRTPALAYGVALLVILIVGTGGAQMAGLNPIGSIIRVLFPASASSLPTATAEWKPGVGAAGTLVVRLQASPTFEKLSYQLRLEGLTPAQSQGQISGAQPTALELPLSKLPEGGTLTLTLEAPPGASATQTIPISVPSGTSGH